MKKANRTEIPRGNEKEGMEVRLQREAGVRSSRDLEFRLTTVLCLKNDYSVLMNAW